jgi:hypothetical protein
MTRDESLKFLADVLDQFSTRTRAEAKALIKGVPSEIHPDVIAVLANVQHYVADYDIRAKDDEYARIQEREIQDLISALRRGDSLDELLNFSLIP